MLKLGIQAVHGKARPCRISFMTPGVLDVWKLLPERMKASIMIPKP